MRPAPVTQEAVMPSFFVLLNAVFGLADRATDRARGEDRESGQGALEYVGMLLVAALIVFAVSQTKIGDQLAKKVTEAVTKAFS